MCFLLCISFILRVEVSAPQIQYLEKPWAHAVYELAVLEELHVIWDSSCFHSLQIIDN